jgi:hypothetical protein
MSDTKQTDTPAKWQAYQDSLLAVGRITSTTSCVRHRAERGAPCFEQPVAVCGNRVRDWARGHDSTGTPTG